MHEAQLHSENSFLTLTYEKAPLSLVPADLRDFWKRLRWFLGSQRISYFAAGEYGEVTRRPHYHACVFGYWPSDAVFHKHTARGDSLYRSAELERLWGHGIVWIGAVTFESAQYVAGYIAKKVTGELAEVHYRTVDEHGEIHELEPEFSRSSRKPAVGLRWLNSFGESDAWRHDSVVTRGARSKVPKYYDRKFSERKPERAIVARKRKRIEQGNTRRARFERTPDRLLAAEVTTLSKLQLRKRDAQ